jgi:hypothetical protein
MAQPLTYDNAIELGSTVEYNQLSEHRRWSCRGVQQTSRIASCRSALSKAAMGLMSTWQGLSTS